MGYCNLLNYVFILVKEKKQKEIWNKHTHTSRTHLRMHLHSCLMHTLTPCMSFWKGTLLLAAVVCPRLLWSACGKPRILPYMNQLPPLFHWVRRVKSLPQHSWCLNALLPQHDLNFDCSARLHQDLPQPAVCRGRGYMQAGIQVWPTQLVVLSKTFNEVPSGRSIDRAHFPSVMLASTMSSRSPFTAATILQLLYTPWTGVHTRPTASLGHIQVHIRIMKGTC
jgi:hypothetical protein